MGEYLSHKFVGELDKHRTSEFVKKYEVLFEGLPGIDSATERNLVMREHGDRKNMRLRQFGLDYEAVKENYVQWAYSFVGRKYI